MADRPIQAEPRWPAILAVLATGGLYLVLPERLTPGPNWLLLGLITPLLVLAVVSHRAGNARLSYILGFCISGLITLAMVWSLGCLIAGLPGKRQPAPELLRSAVALWTTNILVFASWYWRLDAGGPFARERRASHTEGAFLFPQMTMHTRSAWRPGFIDYLFLAFNTSTAFSPTDVPVLSRWAKVLMMVQSSISLGTIAILAARAINIL
ncbi:MAG: DUF1345 domain-containing protein [Acidobacteriaceae bacterium]|nr:DUF1345 domain-containing protein [Acidobacteriaceae bacterium]